MAVDSTKLEGSVMKVLETVKDPEIDSVSVLDLGMIEEVVVNDGAVSIKALPTFVGCPALDILEKNIKHAVEMVEGVEEVNVQFLKTPPWTSDRITDLGRERLKEFGISPPPKNFKDDGNGWVVDCPYCGSPYTTMENIFGPTACRSILYCKQCKNPFEAMKPVSTMM